MAFLYVRVKNYCQALGIVAAVKARVNPLSLRRDIQSPLEEFSNFISVTSESSQSVAMYRK